MTRTTTIAVALLLASSQLAAAKPPGRAKKFDIYFVTAYDQCIPAFPPDFTHQPPFFFEACVPVQSSTALTFGHNGYGHLSARGTYRPTLGQADAKLIGSFHHVQDGSGPFNGTLSINMTLRLTDNACTGSGTACTLPDLQLTVPVPCGSSIPGGGPAGTCAVNTTVNTLLPGSLAPNMGTVISIGQLSVEHLATRAFEGGLFLP